MRSLVLLSVSVLGFYPGRLVAPGHDVDAALVSHGEEKCLMDIHFLIPMSMAVS